MTDSVRGRVLIINNKKSNKPENITGSDIDYRSLVGMFKDLKFDVAKSKMHLNDLTAQVFSATCLFIPLLHQDKLVCSFFKIFQDFINLQSVLICVIEHCFML